MARKKTKETKKSLTRRLIGLFFPRSKRALSTAIFCVILAIIYRYTPFPEAEPYFYFFSFLTVVFILLWVSSIKAVGNFYLQKTKQAIVISIITVVSIVGICAFFSLKDRGPPYGFPLYPGSTGEKGVDWSVLPEVGWSGKYFWLPDNAATVIGWYRAHMQTEKPEWRKIMDNTISHNNYLNTAYLVYAKEDIRVIICADDYLREGESYLTFFWGSRKGLLTVLSAL